jgi:hypothetical protein
MCYAYLHVSVKNVETVRIIRFRNIHVPDVLRSVITSKWFHLAPERKEMSTPVQWSTEVLKIS